MNNILVSIVVPIYNLENYLFRCIESLIHQTYNNIEIILINDGSTDNSISIINKYSERDSRIIVIDKENQGVSVARNVGIEKSSGKYIMFVDGDDWIDSDMIEKLVIKAEKYKADYVGAGFIFEDIENKRKRLSPGGFSPIVFEHEEVLKNYLVGNYIWSSVWGGIYLKDTIQKYDIKFDPKIKFAEDVLFTTFFMIFARKVIVCKNRFYHVLVRTTSVTRNSVHELDKTKKKPDIEGLLRKYNKLNEYQEYYKAWFVRFSNYELFHLALKVDYKTFKSFYKSYVSTTKYKTWNNVRLRRMMGKKHRMMSIIGNSSLLIWLSMNIPRFLGKKIIA